MLGGVRICSRPARRADAKPVMTAVPPGGLISEHFSQSCSWSCNAMFWDMADKKGRHVADHESYARCCQACPGNVCVFPCAKLCSESHAKARGKCGASNVTCAEGAEREHTDCCSQCPGGTCVAETALDDQAFWTCGGTAAGAPCTFPFTYKGKEYS